MQTIDPATARIETVLGALLYMMTMFQRCRCRNLASAIAAHLDCLARHPDADEVVREMAEGLWGEWRNVAGQSTPNVSVGFARKHPTVLN